MPLTLLATKFHEEALSQPITKRFEREGGTLGRGVECDFVLPDASKHISRTHARIVFNEDRFWLLQLGRNASRINSSEVEADQIRPLSSGDVLMVGPYRILVEVEPDFIVPDQTLHGDSRVSPTGMIDLLLAESVFAKHLPPAVSTAQESALRYQMQSPAAGKPDNADLAQKSTETDPYPPSGAKPLFVAGDASDASEARAHATPPRVTEAMFAPHRADASASALGVQTKSASLDTSTQDMYPPTVIEKVFRPLEKESTERVPRQTPASDTEHNAQARAPTLTQQAQFLRDASSAPSSQEHEYADDATKRGLFLNDSVAVQVTSPSAIEDAHPRGDVAASSAGAAPSRQEKSQEVSSDEAILQIYGFAPNPVAQVDITLDSDRPRVHSDASAQLPATQLGAQTKLAPVREFLAAAGLADLEFDQDGETVLLKRAGMLLREVMLGLHAAMRANERALSELQRDAADHRPGETEVARAANPSEKSDGALRAALATHDDASAMALVRDALARLTLPHRALEGGVHAVAGAMVSRLDPSKLEQRLSAPTWLDRLTPARRKARLWELVKAVHHEVSTDLGANAGARLMEVFVDAIQASARARDDDAVDSDEA